GDQTGSQVIDFTATGASVLGVVVKGGPNANFYDYQPGGVSFGTGLHSPVNPSNEMFYGLSHVSFCYVKTPPSSPPPTTTPPTSPPTTTPTSPPTTAPTSPPPSTPSETPSPTSSTTSPIGTPSETESSPASVPTEVPAGLGGPDATNTSSGHGALYVGGLTLLAAGLALIGVGTAARMKRGKHMA
ncbi:MAG TPA: hypothetical protein VGJ44_10880, partial [Kribbellaceae bacterium]